MAKDPDFYGNIREIARPTAMDIVLLMLTLVCFALLMASTWLGWQTSSGYAFFGAIAFAAWVLNIVNRTIGTMRRMYDRLQRLERELENLMYDRDHDREAGRDTPTDMRN